MPAAKKGKKAVSPKKASAPKSPAKKNLAPKSKLKAAPTATKAAVKTAPKEVKAVKGKKVSPLKAAVVAVKAAVVTKVAILAKPAAPVKAPAVKGPVVKGTVTKETIAKKTRATIKNSISDSGKKAAETLSRLKGTAPASSISMAGVGDSVCREVACEGLATTSGYCRLHYIKNWKRIKRKELILKEKKLNRFIEELVAKYPDKYIEVIRQDLTSDKDFNKVISDLDIDESPDDVDGEGENVEAIIDNIKRDFDDDDTGF